MSKVRTDQVVSTTGGAVEFPQGVVENITPGAPVILDGSSKVPTALIPDPDSLVMTVLDNAAKLAIISPAEGLQVIMTAEGNRIEEYISGDPTLNSSWAEIREGRVQIDSDIIAELDGGGNQIGTPWGGQLQFPVSTVGRWRFGFNILFDSGGDGSWLRMANVPNLTPSLTPSDWGLIRDAGYDKQGISYSSLQQQPIIFNNTNLDSIAGGAESISTTLGYQHTIGHFDMDIDSVPFTLGNDRVYQGSSSSQATLYAGSFVTISRLSD